MKIVQITAPGVAELLDLPVPEPGAGEVRVKVVACNTCPQWDLHVFGGEPMFVGAPLPYPYTAGQPGHEMTGIVDAVGPGVSGLAPGQRVAAWKDAGHKRQGCYAEYVCHAAEHLLPVPDDIDPLRVASLELAMCVAASILLLRSMNAIDGRVAAVNGLGPAGLIAAQLLRAEGAASVTGFDPTADRRDLAREHGFVDETLDPTAPETIEALPPAHFPGRRAGPYEVAVDCVGYPQAVRFLMDRTRRHVALFAVQRDDYAFTPGHRELILCGYPGHSREAAEYALARILADELDLRPLASVELPLERYTDGVEMLRRQEAMKVCYRP